jgi:hypothetical protein
LQTSTKITIHNASAVKIHNASSCLVRFESENIYFYFEKRFTLAGVVLVNSEVVRLAPEHSSGMHSSGLCKQRNHILQACAFVQLLNKLRQHFGHFLPILSGSLEMVFEIEVIRSIKRAMTSRVAKFFLVQYTNTGENITNYHKRYQTSIKYIKWS